MAITTPAARNVGTRSESSSATGKAAANQSSSP